MLKEAARVSFFPNWEPRAGGSPNLQRLRVRARSPANPFKQIEDKRINWIVHGRCLRVGQVSGRGLAVGFAAPNVRGEAGPTVGRQARAADDNEHGCAGLVARRWASPRPRG